MAGKGRKIASIHVRKLANVHEKTAKPLYDHSLKLASVGYGKKKRARA